MSPKAGHTHGLLLDAVDNHGSIRDRYKDPIALRKRWYNDVARMITQLHEADIVWGDFKLANMLVDEKDDVWLIDFGGGMTEGWLDRESIETEKGDLQGLAEFKKFLRLKNLKRKDGLRSKTRKQSPVHQSPDTRRQQSPDKAREQSGDQTRAHSVEKTRK